jgi:hypothetical protein
LEGEECLVASGRTATGSELSAFTQVFKQVLRGTPRE